VLLFPAFRHEWEAPNNCFVGDDGSFSFCGVFSELGHFFRGEFDSLPQSALEEFGRFVSKCLDHPQSELDEAAATCFLENMAYEPFSARLKRHLHGEALEFYSTFDEPS
jgi:hypothetical protein